MHRDQSRKNRIKQTLDAFAKNDPNFFILPSDKGKPEHSEQIRFGQTLLILAVFTLAVGAYPLPFSSVRIVLFAIASALALAGAWHIDRANIASKKRE
jgi:hypothetical protein